MDISHISFSSLRTPEERHKAGTHEAVHRQRRRILINSGEIKGKRTLLLHVGGLLKGVSSLRIVEEGVGSIVGVIHCAKYVGKNDVVKSRACQQSKHRFQK